MRYRDLSVEEATAREPRVAIRFFDGCPHWRTAYERMNEVSAEDGYEDVTLALETVESPEDAERLRFIGSPTILLDGEDPFAPDAAGGYGLSCRLYSTPEGPDGSPTIEQFREALDRRLGDQPTS
jgi:hypothetical protein